MSKIKITEASRCEEPTGTANCQKWSHYRGLFLLNSINGKFPGNFPDLV